MLLEEGATTMLLHDARLAPRHVDEPVRGIAVEAERPHRPRLRLVGAAQEAVEPAVGNNHVVVHEADVLRVGMGEGEATRFHGGEIVLGADEGETALPGATLQVSPDVRGRATVDVHELVRHFGVGKDAFEGRARHTKLLAWRHDHRRSSLGHKPLRCFWMGARARSAAVPSGRTAPAVPGETGRDIQYLRVRKNRALLEM